MDKKINNDKIIKDVRNLNKSHSDLLNRNNSALGTNNQTRDDEVTNIVNRVRGIVASDIISTRSNKPVGTSAYEYIVNSVTGDGRKKDKNNNGSPTLAQKNNFENVFSKDSNVAAMFLNTNSSYVTICDEIESVSAFMFQLNDAIDIIRDNVLSCEQVNEDVSMEFSFGSAVDKEESKSAEQSLRSLGDTYGIPQKLRYHITPNSVRYGRYYVLTIPYNEILQMISKDSVRFESVESEQVCLENVINLENLNIDKFEDTETMTPIVETIIENMKNISICESTVGSHIPSSMAGLEKNSAKLFKDMIIKTKTKGKVDPNDRLIGDAVKDLDNLSNIPGCHVSMADPRVMLPVKILDHVVGYYYFDNYDYTQMGSSVTDIMSNRLNTNDRNMVIDNVVDNVLGTLKYGDLLAGNKDFKSLILNSLLYKERINNPIKIRFIPPQYVTPFNTNLDENGEGRPVLLRSLFYARLYTTLLLFNFSTILTKSTDTEFYYLNESAIDTKYLNRISEFQEQLQMSSIDPTQIINGDVLHGNTAIIKRHFLPKGANGEKLFDMEVVSGQSVDIYSDFMQELKNSAISSTGVPAVMVDYTNEIEYARMFSSANIKHLKACINIQTEMNPSITQLYYKLAKFEGLTNVPEEMLESLKITLKKPKTAQNNISADSVGSVVNTIEQMVDIQMGGRNTELTTEQELLKEEIIRRLVRDRTPDLPWALMDDLMDQMNISSKLRDLEAKAFSQESEE